MYTACMRTPSGDPKTEGVAAVNKNEILNAQVSKTRANGHTIKVDGKRVTAIDFVSRTYSNDNAIAVTFQGRKYATAMDRATVLEQVEGQLLPLMPSEIEALQIIEENTAIRHLGWTVEHEKADVLKDIDQIIGDMEHTITALRQQRARAEHGDVHADVAANVVRELMQITGPSRVGSLVRDWSEYCANSRLLEQASTRPLPI